MKSAFPLLVAGGAALLLMGGKKKKKSSGASSDESETPMDSDDGETDEGDGPAPDDDSEYGKVASGIRNDRIGAHSWRVIYEEDGYHAQVMTGPGKFAAMSFEVGVAASLKAAKILLRDSFNQALLDGGHSEDDFFDDPAPRTVSRLAMN